MILVIFLKYNQTYAFECGICSIKNLLKYYHIECDYLTLPYQRNGNSLYEMKGCLLSYFKQVVVAKINLEQFISFKKIDPFILLIKKENQYHYVVVYKIKKNDFFILDSAQKGKIKISFSQLNKIATHYVILVKQPFDYKKSKKKIKINKTFIFIPFLSIIESSLLLLSSSYLQKMIDTQLLNPFYFILLELILYSFILYRSRIYLKHFKILDHKIVQNTLHSIYQLKKDFLLHRDKEEIIYRMNDAYQMKQIILSFLFDFIGNVILLLSTFLFLIFYHPAFILFFLFMIPIFIFSYHHLKKHQHFIEKKRKDEYLFFDKLREDISTHSLDESHYLTCHNFLFNYQKIDFLMEKNKLLKNQLFYFFQNAITCLLLLVYFFKLIPFFSIGKLIACMNLLSLIMAPLFQVLLQIHNYSNYFLLKQRLDDLKRNHK